VTTGVALPAAVAGASVVVLLSLTVGVGVGVGVGEDVGTGATEALGVGVGVGEVDVVVSDIGAELVEVSGVTGPPEEPPPELPEDGAGVIVSPEPVSQTRPSGSVAIPSLIVVPLARRKTPLE
ncbi:MAG: hypothetical protein EBY74_06435, partial [Actinobacteria bacterium]|nr:hypothetical protein [Actinomycetota bacterium]